jgi:hypothetical protein
MLTVKRAALFLLGCIGMRSLFAYAAFAIPAAYLPYLGLLALLPVIGWTYILVTGARKTGMEVDGERIWWNGLRPLHAVNYAAFAAAALLKNRDAYLFLVWDVILGLGAWIHHHFIGKN